MATRKTKVNPMQDIERQPEQDAAESTIAQLNETTIQAAETGTQPKPQRVTFFANPTTWASFKTYAESRATTASELLTEFLVTTVEQNQARIEKFAEGKARLLKSLDE